MTNQIEKPEIDFTRVNNDTNGNPRYVCHFSELINEGDRIRANLSKSDMFGIETQYNIALAKAKTIGGRKYSNKQYGGGIVFQSYNTADEAKLIRELKEVNTDFVKSFTYKQFKQAQKAIYKHISASKYLIVDDHSRPARTLQYLGSYASLDAIAGFAYTSSGAYAGIWICNGVYFMVNKTHHLIGFTINAKGEIVAIAEDENENTIYITI